MERDIIQRLVAAMGIEADQVVLLNFWGEEEERETLHRFAQEIAVIGGCPIEWMQSRKLNGKLFSRVEAPFSEKFYQVYDCVDVVIDIMMQSIGIPGPELPREKYELYNKHLGTFFSKVMSKEKIIQIRIPTKQNALEAGIDPEKYMQMMNEAYNIDYVQLKKGCEEKIAGYQKKTTLTVYSGQGCKLTLDTTDRQWFIDAGDGDLPCGEVYISPVEGKAEGTVYFEQLDLEEKGSYPDVTLTIKDGKIISSTCKEFNEFLKELPENGDVVAELGIGMNPNVISHQGYPLLDEKRIGTFHIGIGENRMSGGNNACPGVHMDFVTVGTVE